MTELDTIVAKFRSGSPNIAAAFDEVQRRLVALEPVPPPPPPPPEPPPVATVPTGLTATPGDGKVALSWTANPAAEQIDGYQVYVDAVALELDVDATSFEVTGLTNGTAYSFRVSAHNTEGYGDWSAAVSATPVAPVVVPPSSARLVAAALYEGYTDVGDVPLWNPNGEQAKADDRLTIVNDPLGQRGKVMRVHVKPGDNNVSGSGTGERAEVMCGSDVNADDEGGIVATAISFMLPADFQSNGSQWNAIHQWHGTGSGGQPNIFLSVRNGKDLDLRIMGRQASSPWRADIALGAVAKERWYDFVLGEVLSADPTRGRCVVMLDDDELVDRAVANKYTDQGRYPKQGMYRVGGQTYPVTLFMGPTRFWTADTLDDAVAAARSLL